ncbi:MULTISPECIES: DUF308 domain-containing protein [unclassified Sphingomonas]|uniref:HdeD family acid-resistance protein n=1 Tax=unclassified Sphingomonas TaxID=196159 RepID=UPI00092AADCE|nr:MULTISPECIES: DUF308 domain-containing protein [unclassified Sphingomonas]OJU21393.1 MAG: hypothetical protein BGN95_03690 [Sphingomonas sp. 66-10]
MDKRFASGTEAIGRTPAEPGEISVEPEDEPFNERATDHWPAIGLKAGAAALLGIALIAWPAMTVAVLVAVFAAYCFADALFSVILATHHARIGSGWLALGAVGLIDAITGIVALARPAATVDALLTMVTAWAIIVGLATIFGAGQLRPDHGRGWLIGSGLAIFFAGVLLGIGPALGFEVVKSFLAVGLLVSGAFLFALAYQLRLHRGDHHHAQRPAWRAATSHGEWR